MRTTNHVRRPASVILAFGITLGFACRQDMHDQPRYKPFAPSSSFGDERSARPLVPGTVARGHLRDNPAYDQGKSGKAFVETFPVTVDEVLVRRGQQRFNIYCSPCHGQTGRGNGMVVQRGYRRPPTFHQDRLRAQPPGYFFDVITNGFGAMPDYAAQISAQDRWAIVAYVRALQLSQYASVDDVPAAHRHELDLPEGAGSGAEIQPEAHHP